MKKLLTTRQLSMTLFICVISLKFLVFPALSTKYAGRDAYIAIFFYLLIEFSIILLILQIMKKYPNHTFKDIISDTLGKYTAKIIYAVLFIYFLAKTLFLIKETHNYFLEVIFDELPWFYFTMPLTAFLCFVMTKNTKVMSRTIEIMFWIIIITIGVTSISPSYRIDMFNILPMFENGISPVLNGMFYTTFSFGDFLVLILFMGKVDMSKGISKIIYYGILCIIFVTAFYIMFIAIFDNSGINHILALSDISVRSSYPYTQEKLDWLAILIWTIILLYQIGVYAILTKNCICEVIHFKYQASPIAIIATILFISSLLLYFNLELVVRVSSSVPFLICVIAIHILVPLILIIATVIYHTKNSRRYGNAQARYSKEQV